MSDGFAAVCDESINVAVAMRRAADEHALKLLPPDRDREVALDLAIRRLEELRQRLRTGTPQTFFLVLVESGLWSRFEVSESEVRAQHHLVAPSPGDPIIVTGEAVLAALLGGQLSPGEAISRRLVIASGDNEKATALLAVLDWSSTATPTSQGQRRQSD